MARFAERELRPRMHELEAAGAWDEPTLKVLDDFVLPGLDLPEAWGGAGAGALAKVVALEAVAYGDAGGLPAADTVGASAPALLDCPDGALAGEIAQACLAREGRSLVVLGPRARLEWAPGREAPRWAWVSEGEHLELLDTRDCPVTPAPAGAFAASGGVAVVLAGAPTAGGWRIGGDGGLRLRGWARLWPAAVALGVARASLDYAVEYARERVVMGKPVAHHQGNAFAIAEAATVVEAARLAVRSAAHRLDREDPSAGLSATLASLDALEAALSVTDLGVQLLGGHGYVEDHPVEKWFREARALAQLLGGRDGALEDAGEAVLDTPVSL